MQCGGDGCLEGCDGCKVPGVLRDYAPPGRRIVPWRLVEVDMLLAVVGGEAAKIFMWPTESVRQVVGATMAAAAAAAAVAMAVAGPLRPLAA